MKTLRDMHEKVKFQEDIHKYWVRNTEYKSVTTILKRFYPEFNAEEISTKLSKGDEVKKAKLLYDWAVSSPWGSMIHRLLELHLLGNDVDVDYKQFHEGVRLIKELEDEGWLPIIPEMRVFNKDIKVAGTVDLPMFHVNNQNRIKIVDFKTSDKIPKTSFDGTCMFEPLDHIHDCKLTHYQLQLSVYAYFIDVAFDDLIIDSLEIMHLPKGQEGKRIEVDYLKEDIELIMEVL